MKNENAVALGRMGRSIGGFARAESLSPEERKGIEIASKAAQTRWNKFKENKAMEKEISFDELLGENFNSLASEEIDRSRKEIIRLQKKILKLEAFLKIDLSVLEENGRPRCEKREEVLNYLKSKGCPVTVIEITEEMLLKGFKSRKGTVGLRLSIYQVLYSLRDQGLIKNVGHGLYMISSEGNPVNKGEDQ